MICCPILLVFISILLLNGCAGGTTFRVLDAITKEPIEGAVALATWTDTRGLPGFSSSYTAKAVESETGPDGIFRIPAIFSSLAFQKPHIKVYKPGYVGWDSLRIYLGSYKKDKTLARTKKREGFTKGNQDIYLEPWKKEYSYMSHYSFIQTYKNLSKDAGIKDSKYENAIHYEAPFYLKERESLNK